MPHLDLTKEKEEGHLLESYESDRGTRIEMIRSPLLGITCYMDGLLQSCEMDEKIYHENIVSFALHHVINPKNVLILGGGEGAVAREVLLCEKVEEVDMYDWDEEVVSMFRERYPQWGKDAWSDRRLHVYHQDVFEVAQHGFMKEKYDVILIDLFDPSSEMLVAYSTLIRHLSNYLDEKGAMVMYCGVKQEEATKTWIQRCLENTELLPSHSRYPYQVFIPSFNGDAAFFAWLPRQ